VKIQVGKTYKDGFGNEVYIEAKHLKTNDAIAGYPYFAAVVSSPNRGFVTYSEEGKARVFGRPAIEDSEYDLVPNKITVTKYAYAVLTSMQYHPGSLMFDHTTNRDARIEELRKMGSIAVPAMFTYEIEEE
jgi:hypothetical protein